MSQSNYFSLFQLPKQFSVDTEQLATTYRKLAAQFHPDKAAALSAFEQKQFVMMSAMINQAYQTLSQPIDRAAYLLQLAGIDADAPEHTSFAPEFLMQQMQWREDLMDAKMDNDELKLQQLKADLSEAQQDLWAKLALAFEQNAFDDAADWVRQGRFLDKMQRELDLLD